VGRKDATGFNHCGIGIFAELMKGENFDGRLPERPHGLFNIPTCDHAFVGDEQCAAKLGFTGEFSQPLECAEAKDQLCTSLKIERLHLSNKNGPRISRIITDCYGVYPYRSIASVKSAAHFTSNSMNATIDCSLSIALVRQYLLHLQWHRFDCDS